jgi:hypothetical protein
MVSHCSFFKQIHIKVPHNNNGILMHKKVKGHLAKTKMPCDGGK